MQSTNEDSQSTDKSSQQISDETSTRLSTPITIITAHKNTHQSNSWNGYSKKNYVHNSKYHVPHYIYSRSCEKMDDRSNPIGYNIPVYDAINNCRSAGIIPYAFNEGILYFLFQRIDIPKRKKDGGWNDFGGKAEPYETTMETAAREFSEETSCLFYVVENSGHTIDPLYNILKNNELLQYDDYAIDQLKKLIPKSTTHYTKCIMELASPLYVNSKETYISYFVRTHYLPADDLPRAEDIHIPYEERYIRTCKWFSISELMDVHEKDFHKRLQITKLQNRTYDYYQQGLFI